MTLVTLQLLGASGLQVIQPGSIQALIADGQTFFQGGRLVGGAAMEFMPGALALGTQATIKNYLNANAISRALTWSSLSFATAQDGAATRLAGGWRVRWHDDSDWRLHEAAILAALNVLEKVPLETTIDPTTGQEFPSEKAKEITEENLRRLNAAEPKATAAFAEQLKTKGLDPAGTQIASGLGVVGAFNNGSLNAGTLDNLSLWWSRASTLSAKTSQGVLSVRMTGYFPGARDYPTGQVLGGFGGRWNLMGERYRLSSDVGTGYGTASGVEGMLGVTTLVKPAAVGQWVEVSILATATSLAGSKIVWNFSLRGAQDIAAMEL